ncbi:hypothetical protein PIB30_098428 [Stylosanthes scabra]|uniref:Uncharacterized protein n=1 Tax=Stylosanthes scabra TaxID=79078 RepID=A0ABU6QXN5_9FABA|nr:hypothetical protein [Stylosanthes scabra]
MKNPFINLAAWKRRTAQALVTRIRRSIEPLQVTALRYGTAKTVVTHIELLQELELSQALWQRPGDAVVPQIKRVQVRRKPHLPDIESEAVLRQRDLLRVLLCTEQH